MSAAFYNDGALDNGKYKKIDSERMRIEIEYNFQNSNNVVH